MSLTNGDNPCPDGGRCLQIQGQEVARLEVNRPAPSPRDMVLRDTPCL